MVSKTTALLLTIQKPDMSGFWIHTVLTNWKFPNQTHFYHLNTGPVKYLDPHCVLKMFQVYDEDDGKPNVEDLITIDL